MEKKTYSKVLPLKDNEKVVTQVGWLPLSVIEPPRQTKNPPGFKTLFIFTAHICNIPKKLTYSFTSES